MPCDYASMWQHVSADSKADLASPEARAGHAARGPTPRAHDKAHPALTPQTSYRATSRLDGGRLSALPDAAQPRGPIDHSSDVARRATTRGQSWPAPCRSDSLSDAPSPPGAGAGRDERDWQCADVVKQALHPFHHAEADASSQPGMGEGPGPAAASHADLSAQTCVQPCGVQQSQGSTPQFGGRATLGDCRFNSAGGAAATTDAASVPSKANADAAASMLHSPVEHATQALDVLAAVLNGRNATSAQDMRQDAHSHAAISQQHRSGASDSAAQGHCTAPQMASHQQPLQLAPGSHALHAQHQPSGQAQPPLQTLPPLTYAHQRSPSQPGIVGTSAHSPSRHLHAPSRPGSQRRPVPRAHDLSAVLLRTRPTADAVQCEDAPAVDDHAATAAASAATPSSSESYEEGAPAPHARTRTRAIKRPLRDDDMIDMDQNLEVINEVRHMAGARNLATSTAARGLSWGAKRARTPRASCASEQDAIWALAHMGSPGAAATPQVPPARQRDNIGGWRAALQHLRQPVQVAQPPSTAHGLARALSQNAEYRALQARAITMLQVLWLPGITPNTSLLQQLGKQAHRE